MNCLSNIGRKLREDLEDIKFHQGISIDFNRLLLFIAQIRSELPISFNSQENNEANLESALKMVTAYRVGYCFLCLDNPESEQINYLEKCFHMDMETMFNINIELSAKCVLDPVKTYNTFAGENLDLAHDIVAKISTKKRSDKDEKCLAPNITTPPVAFPASQMDFYSDRDLIQNKFFQKYQDCIEGCNIGIEIDGRMIIKKNIISPQGTILDPDLETMKLLDGIELIQ